MRARRVGLGFEGGPTRRALPAMMASIVLLTGLAVAALAGADAAIARWQYDLRARLAVEVGAPSAEGADTVVAAALDVLRGSPGVVAAREIAGAEVRALLEPWLGEASEIASLPLPRLIDVELDPGGADAAVLAARLQERVPGARLDDHGRWLDALSRLALAARLLAGGALTLTAIAAVLVIVLTTHAGLAARRDTIEILRLLGAPDRLVARLFQRQILVMSAIGAAGGFALAVAVLLVLYDYLAPLAATYGLPAALPRSMWLALPAVPILAAAAAALACRVTVRRLLGRMP
ncbi:MAG: FtsX-like permease family protein [Alphaproteobacteria bacterium]|nr:FtsX-like permease family protein [Alphaproteobacteria bacterium]